MRDCDISLGHYTGKYHKARNRKDLMRDCDGREVVGTGTCSKALNPERPHEGLRSDFGGEIAWRRQTSTEMPGRRPPQ